MNNADFGREGEALASDFLRREGYEILECNYRKSFGEIDLIAMDGNTLCFIEVKTRLTDDYGHPFEAVTRSKQRVIRKLASCYLAESSCKDQWVRFDVVGISWDKTADPDIELLKDAF